MFVCYLELPLMLLNAPSALCQSAKCNYLMLLKSLKSLLDSKMHHAGCSMLASLCFSIIIFEKLSTYLFQKGVFIVMP